MVSPTIVAGQIAHGVIQANIVAPFCPPNSDAPGSPEAANENEDYLFLNVYAPSNASSLPILVWIHRGGYGEGNGHKDLSSTINVNDNSFAGVEIQQRVRTPDLERNACTC
jgi:carboxylesterase type B